MKKTFHTWIAFLLCLAILFVAMGWLSWTMLRLDKAEEAARRQVIMEENVRLALWRMDSALTPIISQESAYPYFYFKSYYPASRAYSNMFNDAPSDFLIPSPLKEKKSPYILLHFQFEPDGALTSPEVSVVLSQTPNDAKYTLKENKSSEQAYEKLKNLIDRDNLKADLSQKESRAIISSDHTQESIKYPNQPARLVSQAQVQRPRALDEREWEKRAEFSQQAIVINIDNSVRNFPPMSTDVSGGIMQPLWMGENLFLVRRIHVNGKEYIQGCWMDWDTLQSWLLKSISDLLPNANLIPTLPNLEKGKERMLATLPVSLVPGEIVFREQSGFSPIRFILVIAWICVLIAVGAAGGLLFGTLSLSERRAAFASAVTHELRTPLTTLRMYTEMLSEGMIEDQGKMIKYLKTIRAEADRLGHLVENVFTFSRLERRRLNYNTEVISVKDILQRAKERLSRRANQSAMELVIEEQKKEHLFYVKVDLVVIEQILFNLIDNACKYAAKAGDKRIHIETGVTGGKAFIKVRDHGPGISPKAAGRLFRAFGKSAPEAANSAPGVGLGLALSRRLARMMSGNLSLDRTVKDGACLILILPLVRVDS